MGAAPMSWPFLFRLRSLNRKPQCVRRRQSGIYGIAHLFIEHVYYSNRWQMTMASIRIA